MTRVDARLTRLEQRRKPGQMHIVCFWDDDGHITDDDGVRMTLAEYETTHPDCTVICLTWGDDDDEKILAGPIAAELWNGV